MARCVHAWLVAVILVTTAAAARAQTSSADSRSLEVSSRAEELARSSEHARAAQLFRRAIQLDETNVRAYIGLSAALLALGRHDEALEALSAAEAVLGPQPELALQRATHLVRLKRWKDALSVLDAVPATIAEGYTADRVRAAAHLGLEQWSEAVAAFDRFLQRRPTALRSTDPFVKTRLAFALIQQGDYVRARHVLGEVLAVVPGKLSARVLLFTALAKDGECANALRLYADLERAITVVPTLLYNAAVCRYRLGDERRALALLDDLRARRPLPDRALLLSARIHASLGDDTQAEASYRAALAAGLDAEVELARWLTKRGEHGAVVELLAPLVEADTRDPDVLYLAATAFQRVGELERAADASARLVELSPALRSWLLEGEIQLQRRRWEAAERAYLRAIAATDARDERAAAGLRQALEHRASVAFRAGDREAAHALLVRAHAADSSADRVAYDLALLELARGNAARAVALLDGRVDGLPSPAKGHLLLGTALARAGDQARARAELEWVIARDDAPEALRARALAGLAPLLARTAPDRAVALIGRARKLGAGSDLADALASAAAEAQLALAEQAYSRNDTRQLRTQLARIDADALSRASRVRQGVLRAELVARDKGLGRALRQLAAIPDDDLEAANPGELPASALRHALALLLGEQHIRRSSDYARHLASHATALHPFAADGSAAAKRLLTAWYARMLAWALARPALGLARELAQVAPAELRTPAFEHNAILAASTTRSGNSRFARAQIAQLERLATGLPVAFVNLAIDAQLRGDEATALAYLRRIPADDRSAEIREWIRWKELLHGAP